MVLSWPPIVARLGCHLRPDKPTSSTDRCMNLFGLTTLSASTQRRLALVASLAVVVLLLILMWQLVTVLVPYAFSAIVAFLLMPLVNALAARLPGHRRRPGVVRAVTAGLATLLVLLVVVAIVAAALFRLVEGTSTLVERVPAIARDIELTVNAIEKAYRERVPREVQAQIDPRLETAGAAVISSVSNSALQVLGILKSGLSLIIALAGAPIILFYLLYDAPAIGRGIRQLLPGPLRNDLCNIGGLAGSVVIAYIRTQMLMALMVGVVIGLALWAMGVPAAVILGAAAGMGELIPIIGPFLAFVVAAIVVLITNPSLLPLVALVYLAVQLVQNSLIMPRIQGQTTGLHPLAVMFSVAALGSVSGFWGVLIAVPFAAAAYRVLTYSRETWNSAGSPGPDDNDHHAGATGTATVADEVGPLPDE